MDLMSFKASEYLGAVPEGAYETPVPRQDKLDK